MIDPVVSCGKCYPCSIGRNNVCANLEVIGVHRDGGFRSLINVPADNVVPIAPSVPIAVAALAEPFSIAANVLLLTGCVASETVLVYGAGSIGLSILQVTKLKGARCIVVDLDPARLQTAKQFGADQVIVAGEEDVGARMAFETDGLGPYLVIDAAGAPQLLQEAARLVSPAGRIGLLGFSNVASPLVQKDIISKEMAIYGLRLNRKLLPQVVKWLESGALRPKEMIQNSFAAEDAKEAFSMIRNQPASTLKVQLEF